MVIGLVVPQSVVETFANKLVLGCDHRAKAFAYFLDHWFQSESLRRGFVIVD